MNALVSRPAARLHAVAPVEELAAHVALACAATAFAALVHRYIGASRVVVSASSPARHASRGGAHDALHAWTLDVPGDRPLSAIVGGAIASLRGADVVGGAIFERVCLSWSETSDGGAGASFSLVVTLSTMQVDVRASSQRGLVGATSERLAMTQLARHWRALVAAARSPRAGRTTVADAPMLDGPETGLLLDRWSRSEIAPELARPTFLHALFAARVAEDASRIAVEHEGQTLTYGELDAAAERIAEGLRARGVGPGDLIAFQLERGPLVYAVLLGVLKSGAGYVPVDPEAPADRVAFVVSDCGAKLLFVDDARPCPPTVSSDLVIDLSSDWDVVLPSGLASGSSTSRALRTSDPCYVIYTSGSTGRPKGVAVSHASVVHLVHAEQRIFAPTPSDRVLHGFSIAFDAAVEEVWLAFASGATLVVGSKAMLLGDVARALTEARITIWSTVPTLLATLGAGETCGSIEGSDPNPLPTVHTLILGGEACSQALVDRWASRVRLVNTYGPTEATVIATYGDAHPGEPITLGRPVANYSVYLLDRDGRLAPPGAVGEICIGGIGVALGYVRRADLTSTRFIASPFAERHDAPPVLYKTGDLGRFDALGNLEFHGRIDDQVKVRGYRIELGEVEAALAECPGVAQAVALVRSAEAGAALVAFVAPRPGRTLDATAILATLRARLPPYMVPTQLDVLVTLPTLPSGKIDRTSLSARAPVATPAVDAATQPRGPLEAFIAASWAALLGVGAIGRDQDFFVDLGAHSLLAAQAASALRRDARFASLSVADLFAHPTVAALASAFEWASTAHQADVDADAEVSGERPRTDRARFARAGVAQAAALYPIFGLYSAQWLGPYFAFTALREAGNGVVDAAIGAALLLFAIYPAMLVVGVLTKWLVAGRFVEGRYPLWGATFVRWWIVDRVLDLCPTGFLLGTPWLAAYYRLLGAKIGAGVFLGSDSLAAFDLVEIEDDATLGYDASLATATVEDGMLVLAKVRLGARAVVGERAVVAGGATVASDAEIGPLSRVPPNASVGPGERWEGSPARCVGRALHAENSAPIVRPSSLRRAVVSIAFAIAALALPAFVVGAMLPGLLGLIVLEGAWEGHAYLLAVPLVATSFVIILCLEIAVVKWVLLGRVREGRHTLFSGWYVRSWIFNQAMGVSLDVVGGLFATLYLNPWYRLLGVRLGRHAEVSTAAAAAPDLLEIGDDSFIADCVAVGTPTVSRGMIEVSRTRIGRGAFIGNSALVKGGAQIGDDALVGCLSLGPDAPDDARPGAAWLGSPAISLPRRLVSDAFSLETTFRPTRALIAQRLAFEALRITLPLTGTILLTCLLVETAMAMTDALPAAAVLALFPLVFAGYGALVAAAVVAAKWLLVGRHRAGERPLWSSFVWRTELVTALDENLAGPCFTQLLEGTPFLAWFLRAMGAKIGARVYLGTTEITEYDLVSIGDDACLDADATLQTHLFEDRVMKMSHVTIGAGCSVGHDAIVLYDGVMEPGSSLGPLSLLMKGESLPAGTRWVGSPARPVAEGRVVASDAAVTSVASAGGA